MNSKIKRQFALLFISLIFLFLLAAGASAATLTITVTNQQNQPLSSATVAGYQGSNNFATRTTNSSGVATFSSIAAGGAYRMVASKSGYNSNEISFTYPSGSTTYSRTIILSPVTVQVRARALNNGSAVSGASVTIVADGTYTYPAGSTDSSGYSNYVGFSPGQSLSITATKPGLISSPVSYTVASSPPQQTASVNMQTATQTIQVRARAVDSSTGNGVSGASVTVNQGSNNYNGGTTDSSGYSSYVALNVGASVIVTASKTGYPTTNVNYMVTSSPSQQTVNVSMTPNQPTVQVRAKALSNGAAVQGATVYINSGGTNFPAGSTDSSGYSSYVSVYTGQVTVTVSKPGYETATQSYNATVSPSQQTANVNLQVTVQAVQVRAQVLNYNGQGIAGATVSFFANGAQYNAGTTDSQGFSSYVNLNSGWTSSVSVSMPGYSPVTQSYSVLYTPSQQTVNVTMGQSSVTLTAAVINSATGLPISGASVTYVSNGASYPGNATDSEGRASPVTLQVGQVVTINATKSSFQNASQTYTILSSPASQTTYVNLVPTATSTCGNSDCENGETQASCPQDCQTSPDTTNYRETSIIPNLVGKNALAGQIVALRINSITSSSPNSGYNASLTLIDEDGTIIQTRTVNSGEYINQVMTVNGLEVIQTSVYVNAIWVDASTGIGYVAVRLSQTTSTTIAVRANVLSNGAPVSDASVTYFVDGVTYPGGLTTYLGYATNSVSLQAGQVVSISVTKTGFQNASQSYTVLGSPENQTVNVNLTPTIGASVSVKAHVTNSVTGQNVSGATVTMIAESTYPAGTTNTSGDSNPVSLQPGQAVIVKVTKNGFQESRITAVVHSSPSTQTINVTLTPAVNVRVKAHVVNSVTGQVVSGASVTYVADGRTYSGGRTSSTGNASSVGLQSGQVVSINVTKDGFLSASESYTMQNSPTEQIVEVRLTPESGGEEPTNNVEVTVRVLTNDAALESIPGAKVVFSVDGVVYPELETNTQNGQTPPINFQRGQSGSITVNKEGYLTRTQTFSVPSQSRNHNVTINLTQASTASVSLRVYVINSNAQEPLQGASVIITVNGQSHEVGTTNNAGYSESVIAERGQSYTARASKEGFESKTANGVIPTGFSGSVHTQTLDLVSTTTPLESTTAEVKIRVIDNATDLPVQGATVTLSYNGLTTPSQTDQDGQSAPATLQHGQQFETTIQKEGYYALTETHTVPLQGAAYEVVARLSRRVQTVIPFSVIVTNSQTGAPIEEAQVLVTVSDSTTDLGLTARDGTSLPMDVIPGTLVSVSVSKPGHQSASWSGVVSVDAAEHVQPVALTPSSNCIYLWFLNFYFCF